MEHPLKVLVGNFSPLVMPRGKKQAGFEIDLWEAVAKEAGVTFEYVPTDFQKIIPLLAAQKADLGMAGLTINEKRERVVDFSFPTLDSGLLILTNRDKGGFRLWDTASYLFHEGWGAIGPMLGWVALFAFLFSNLLWFVEYGHKTFSDSYFPGIFESFWLVLCSMSTDSFGDYVPHTWAGRIVTTGIIVGGVAVFGLLIAQVSSFLTIRKIKGEIDGVEDLSDKKVATVTGSTSVAPVRRVGAEIVSVSDIEDAYEALAEKRVDAVVFDAPVLEYYAQSKKGKGANVSLVGTLFDKQKYGFALPPGSPLREKINVALLHVRESGKYEAIYQKWFGEGSVIEG